MAASLYKHRYNQCLRQSLQLREQFQNYTGFPFNPSTPIVERTNFRCKIKHFEQSIELNMK